tara:strand:- start:732 stop:1106 length:375 start_codon:yes stop_codon:yes gene_type:complete
MAEETVNPAELSKEELAERRREIKEYYEDNIPSLKVQYEYETLLKDIEKARAERLQAQMFIAQTMAGPNGKDDMPSPNPQGGFKTKEEAIAAGKAHAESIKAEMKSKAETAIEDSNTRKLKKAK